MTDLETAIMIKNMAREMVKRATAKNVSDAELLRIYDKANSGYDLFPDLTKPPYNLSKDEERRALQLAQQRNKQGFKEIGHDRARRIAEDRDARRGK